MNHEYYVGELNGYLKALSRTCGWRHHFGIRAEQKNGRSISEFIQHILADTQKYHPESYENHKIIDKNKLLDRIESMIFSGRMRNMKSKKITKDDYSTVFMEDINEYFGLISTSINQDGVFHPLLSSTVFEVDILNVENTYSFYFALEIEDIYIFVYFYERKQ